MFTPDAQARNGPVADFVLLREGMQFALLLRRLRVGTQFRQTLIPAVGQTHRGGGEGGTARLEERKIGLLALTKGGRQDLTGRFVGDYLRFLGVALLFATVVASLFFFGRSQGHSVASSSTTS